METNLIGTYFYVKSQETFTDGAWDTVYRLYEINTVYATKAYKCYVVARPAGVHGSLPDFPYEVKETFRTMAVEDIIPCYYMFLRELKERLKKKEQLL